MEEKKYSILEVEEKATDFLNRKRKRNETTFLNYRTSINYFLFYLKDISEITSLSSENKEDVIEDFQGTLLEGFYYDVEGNEKEVVLKPSTVNTHIRRTKTFLNSIGLTIENLNKLPVNEPEYKALSVDEIKLLINECSNFWSNEEVAVRNETLIKFLFNTAFRINEALGIKTSEVYSEGSNYYVLIKEKGKSKNPKKEVAISENFYYKYRLYILFFL